MPSRFSVAMCTYNGVRFLRPQLDSIATQTRLPDELVICDDASTDHTRAVVTEFAASAPFPVQLHVNEGNLGSTKNFERAIGLCSGDLIALSDQDDVWLPAKLATLESEFERSSATGLIFTDAEIVGDDHRPAGYTLWQKLPIGPDERRGVQAGTAIETLLIGATMTGATMAFRACFKSLVLPIPDDLPIIHDAWIGVLVAAVSKVLPVDAPLIRYRQHDGQQVGLRHRWVAPSARAPGLHSIQTALRRVNQYDELLLVQRRVCGRLLAKRDDFDGRRILARLQPRLGHFDARSSLPRGRLLRVPHVLRELMALRYHRYSNGLRSALKDLVA